MTRRRIAVLGGGISGLAAAYALATNHDVVLFEARPRLGGKLATEQFRSRAVDLGPDSFITRNRHAYDLCIELGLADELVAPAGGGAAIWAERGAARNFPAGLALGIPTNLRALWRSGIMSRAQTVRAAADLLLPGRYGSDPIEAALAGGPDISVGKLIGRRFGGAVLRELVDPLIGGINAGDASHLSFAAAAPQLATRVAGHSSLMRALRTPNTAAPDPGASVAGLPLFIGLRSGIGQLIEALERACTARGVVIHCGSPVTSLAATEPAQGASWKITSPTVNEEVDGIVCALPADRTALLLSAIDPRLSALCGAIRYAGVATLTYAWRLDQMPGARPPTGNGMLVPLAARVGS